MKLIERVNGVPARVTKQHPPIVPREDMSQAVIVPRAEPASRLIASPFAVSDAALEARRLVIQELRRDADVRDAECAQLAKQIAALTKEALEWRNTADHLEKNPP
jgi:hypothetical protein